MTARITSPHRGDRVRFAPVRGDLGIDVGGRQGIEPAPLGAAPGFLQPVGRWRGGAYEILHAHDDDGGLAASVDDALPDGKCAGISMLIMVSCGNTDLLKFLDASVSLSGPRFDIRHKLWSGRSRSPGDRAERADQAGVGGEPVPRHLAGVHDVGQATKY